MNESKRFKLIKSKLRNEVLVFDKLIDEPIAEIASNNNQFNKLMGEACMLIIYDENFRKVVMEW